MAAAWVCEPMDCVVPGNAIRSWDFFLYLRLGAVKNEISQLMRAGGRVA